DLRNYFRSTAAHSTVFVHGHDQGLLHKGTFKLPATVEPVLHHMDLRPGISVFSGTVIYTPTLRHSRKITVLSKEPSFSMEDDILDTSGSSLDLELNIILSPECSFSEPDQVIGVNGKKFMITTDRGNGFQERTAWYSPGYLQKRKTIKLTYTTTCKGRYGMHVKIQKLS
nr:heparinase II/III family protein [Candidatus Sigynarchaeota archaeon]